MRAAWATDRVRQEVVNEHPPDVLPDRSLMTPKEQNREAVRGALDELMELQLLDGSPLPPDTKDFQVLQPGVNLSMGSNVPIVVAKVVIPPER